MTRVALFVVRAGRTDQARPERRRPGDAVPRRPNARLYDGNERGLLLDGVRAGLRDERPLLRLLHAAARTGRSRSTSSSATRTTRTSPIRARAGRCSRFRTRARRTTTAASSSSAPTGCSTSVPATAGAGATVPTRREPPGPAREDPAHRPAAESGQEPYTVPANNPFVGQCAGALPEIWSYGAPEPVALLVRPRHGRPQHSATSVRTRTRRSTTGPSTSGGGEASTSAGAAARAGTSTARATVLQPARPDIVPPVFEYSARCGGVLDHRRLRRPRPGGPEPPRPVRLQRLLQRADLLEHARRSPTRRTTRRPGSTRRNTTSFGEDSCGHVYVAGQGSGAERLAHPADRTRRGSSASRSTTCPS